MVLFFVFSFPPVVVSPYSLFTFLHFRFLLNLNESRWTLRNPARERSKIRSAICDCHPLATSSRLDVSDYAQSSATERPALEVTLLVAGLARFTFATLIQHTRAPGRSRLCRLS